VADSSKKRWRDLTPRQRRTISIAGLIEIIVTVGAVRDLVRRPRDQVVGPKILWFAAFVVQPFGPIAYFAFGRRQPEDDEDRAAVEQ
jgi:phospholipase D-like protein